MKQLIAILTALHVLAHGVFGCCDHATVARADVPKTCCCHHGANHNPDHGDHTLSPNACDLADHASSERPAHRCIHAACHWVVGSAGPIVTPLDFSAPTAIVALLPMNFSALHAAETRLDDVMGRTSAPSLRLHLVVGVLLV